MRLSRRFAGDADSVVTVARHPRDIRENALPSGDQVAVEGVSHETSTGVNR